VVDLKPLNVLLADDGTVRVCDLGGAQTNANALLGKSGTTYYMPPEAFAVETLDKSYGG
jgi:serine/threonine protein kinase